MQRGSVRIFPGVTCLLLVTLVAVTSYYVDEVRVARRDPQTLAAAALKRYGAHINLSELSPVRRAMLLAVVDPTFSRHHGVDLETPGAGMTNLTQGLV